MESSTIPPDPLSPVLLELLVEVPELVSDVPLLESAPGVVQAESKQNAAIQENLIPMHISHVRDAMLM